MIINVSVERVKISMVFYTPETANRITAHYILSELDPFGYYPNVSRNRLSQDTHSVHSFLEFNL